MADKKRFDGSETSEKSKSLLFSLSQAKPASTAEAETSANQSLLYTLWKSVSGKFAKPAQPQEEKPAAQEPEAELFEDDHPLARLRRAWSQEQTIQIRTRRPSGRGICLMAGSCCRFTAG